MCAQGRENNMTNDPSNDKSRQAKQAQGLKQRDALLLDGSLAALAVAAKAAMSQQ
jgi:hypothetical protein